MGPPNRWLLFDGVRGLRAPAPAGTFQTIEKYPIRPKSRRYAAVDLISARLRAGEKIAKPYGLGIPLLHRSIQFCNIQLQNYRS